MSKQVKFIIGIVVLIVFVFILAKVNYKNTEKKVESTNTNQASVLEIKANDWAVGPVDAKVTVVEYLDFECEACGAYYPLTTQLKEEYKDSMRFVVRYFPLPGHKNSRTAAYAVEAAGKQGKFWEMYSILFTKQSEWSEQQVANQDQFAKYAVEAGVTNIEQWKKDVVSDEVKNRVEDSYKEAVSLNLQGTPSFFLNGKKIENPKGYESFKLLIEKAKNN
jgi:protein-disulfide isomerase